jgi:hypothetical protein
MATSTNAIRVGLQNKDLRWYRDKYLAAVFLVSFLVGISLLWAWPLPHTHLIRGARFLAVAGLCLVMSSQWKFILASSMAFVFLRGAVAFFVQHSIGALLVSVVCGAGVYLLTQGKRWRMRPPPYEVKDYSVSEFAIDCAVMGSLLWIYAAFIRDG